MRRGGLRHRFALTLAIAMAAVAVVVALVMWVIVPQMAVNVVGQQGASGIMVSNASGVSVVRQDVLPLVLTIAAAAAVLALPLGWLIAERPTRRIEELTFAAAGITPDRPGARLPVDGSRDEIDTAAHSINRALDRLAEASAAQERFIANASHELRTPLAAARTALEAPSAQGRIPAELEPDIARALGAVQRAQDITAALLRLARTAAPVSGLGNVDVAEMIRRTAAAYSDDAAERQVRLVVRAAEATLRTDATLLAQAVANLLDNAIRHGTGDVTVDGEAAGPGYRITVENPGSVYSQEDAARLVEPFHRGPDSRISGEGSGLGLALVDTIARRLGGAVVLRPREGGGLVAELSTGG